MARLEVFCTDGGWFSAKIEPDGARGGGRDLRTAIANLKPPNLPEGEMSWEQVEEWLRANPESRITDSRSGF
jgi:hypothetical protein